MLRTPMQIHVAYNTLKVAKPFVDKNETNHSIAFEIICGNILIQIHYLN